MYRRKEGRTSRKYPKFSCIALKHKCTDYKKKLNYIKQKRLKDTSGQNAKSEGKNEQNTN